MVALSAILHATALIPFKVSLGPSLQPFPPQLTVDLPPSDTPHISPRRPVATATVEKPVQESHEPSSTRAPTSDAPSAALAERLRLTERTHLDLPTQPTGTPAMPSADAAPRVAIQPQAGVRVAAVDEVTVRVHLLSYAGEQKPTDTILVQGASYVYFRSPGLRRPTQPLDDIKPHYPAQKPAYIHGAVMLQLLIDEAGQLEQAIVVCSNPDFEKSALASVENLRFKPAETVAGPIKSYMVVEFSYGRGFPCASVPDLTPSK